MADPAPPSASFPPRPLQSLEGHYSFMDAMPQLMWVTTWQGEPLFVNQAYVDYTGLSREAARLSWRTVIHPDEFSALVARRADGLAGTRPYEHTNRLRRFDGEYRWHLIRFAPIKDEFGEVAYWCGSATDVHDRQCAEIALMQNEEELEAMFELSGLAKAVVDPDTLRFVRVNQKMCEITGYSRSELLALGIPDITHPEDRASSAQRVHDAVERGLSHWTHEKRYLRKDGGVVWALINGALVRDGAGRPRLAMADIQDITASHQLEDVRRRLAALVENSTDCIGFASIDGKLEFLNKAGCAMIGVEAEEVRRLTIADIFPEQLHALLADTMLPAQIGPQGWRGESFFKHRRTGELIPVSINAGVLRDGQGRIIGRMAICRDISEQRATALALEKSVDRFRQLSGAIAHVVWIAQGDGPLVYINEQWSRITGQTEREALGWGWMAHLHPDDLAVVKERWSAALHAGIEFEVEHRVRGAAGDYRWFLGRARPLKGADGRVAEWFGTCTDVPAGELSS